MRRHHFVLTRGRSLTDKVVCEMYLNTLNLVTSAHELRPDRITILELAERIKELTGSQSENVFVPYDQVYGQGIEDTLHREPAIEKIGSAIGWAPTRNLEDILRDVIEHSRRAPVLPEAEPVTAT